MFKCVCKSDFIDKKIDIDIRVGDVVLYDKYKVKFNTKTGNFKIVRLSQIGELKFQIYDLKEKPLALGPEDWFYEHFTEVPFLREDKISKILDN